jgi:hypothetical protein
LRQFVEGVPEGDESASNTQLLPGKKPSLNIVQPVPDEGGEGDRALRRFDGLAGEPYQFILERSIKDDATSCARLCWTYFSRERQM